MPTANQVGQIAAIVRDAKANPSKYAERGRPFGCARIYIKPSISSQENARAERARLKKIAAAAGLRWIQAMRCVYVGYDNNSGVEFHQGEAIERALNDNGVACYSDSEGD